MSEPKLTAKQLQMLRLFGRSRNVDGWYKVSSVVWPLVDEIPGSLVKRERTDDGGRARLTEEAKTLLEWL